MHELIKQQCPREMYSVKSNPKHLVLSKSINRQRFNVKLWHLHLIDDCESMGLRGQSSWTRIIFLIMLIIQNHGSLKTLKID